MIDFQKYTLAIFDKMAADKEFLVLHVPQWGNTGSLIVKNISGASTVASLKYMFSSGHNTILFNDRTLMDATDMTWLFAETDDAKIAAMFAKWDVLLGGK